jgi:hypothetical protein
MMLINYIQRSQKRITEEVSSFYTPTGIHVYFKEPLANDDVDVERVINKVEERIPSHLLTEVEMVIVGWFDEFEDRKLSAFYKDGTLYISNIQDDESDMYDDIVHEIAHSLESALGYEIYSDQKVHDEFLRKRKYLYDILWARGYKISLSICMDPEYNEEFDMFLYQKIGYDKLSDLMMGLYITPYAATSLREYYATGFAEYYFDSDHNFFRKVSPELYKKLLFIQDPEKLDNIA